MTDPEIRVGAEGERTYRVEVEDSRGSTTHSVEVPVGMAEELGWGPTGEADLVRASVAFLLEREPPTAILRRFSLDVIGRYFPDYRSEIRRGG